MKQITITDQQTNQSYVFENTKQDGGLINQVEGFEYPVPLVTVNDVASRDGATAINSKFGRRICSFTYRTTCDVLNQRREMLKVMRQDGYLKLVKFTTLDDLQLQLEAYISKYLCPYNEMVTPALIELIAPDFRLYNQTLTEYDTAPTTGVGGSAIPSVIPIDLSGGAGGVDNLSVTNAGNIPTPPIFTIYGPGTDFTIQNVTTGKSILIESTIVAGESIIIDIAKRTVTQGSTNIYGLFTGDWFDFPVGISEIYFNANSGTDSNTSLHIALRDAYSGI